MFSFFCFFFFVVLLLFFFLCFFFFNDTATTEIYTLSLHDALPISSEDLMSPELRARIERLCALRAFKLVGAGLPCSSFSVAVTPPVRTLSYPRGIDRKSTRLNSSHALISYAVFCLKKKKKKISAHQSS